MEIPIVRYLNDFLHLFFPSYCAGCFAALETGEDLICTRCRIELPVIDATEAEDKMMLRLTHEVDFVFAFCWLSYQKKGLVANILHSLKYEGNAKLAFELGKIIGSRLLILMKERSIAVNFLVPVPISRRKLKKRGYNQAKELAKGICEVTGASIFEVLKRLDTKQQFSQTTKHRLERFENVKQQFTLIEQMPLQMLTGSHILIVDDVFTTGATLEVCGALFKKSQVASVAICTLSLTV